MTSSIAPGEWDMEIPDESWIREWINGQGPFAANAGLTIPIPQNVLAVDTMLTRYVDAPTINIYKFRVRSFAPWAGRPFHYEWFVGDCGYDRYISGEARIVWEGIDD